LGCCAMPTGEVRSEKREVRSTPRLKRIIGFLLTSDF
jgi:hypothetical protein